MQELQKIAPGRGERQPERSLIVGAQADWVCIPDLRDCRLESEELPLICGGHLRAHLSIRAHR